MHVVNQNGRQASAPERLSTIPGALKTGGRFGPANRLGAQAGWPGLGWSGLGRGRSGLARWGLARSGWLLSDLPVAGGLLLLAVLVRLLGFVPSVLDPDESLYILQAREWLRGGWPYVAVWDMHPVGAPGLIALAFALLGESIAAARLLGAVAVAATGFLLFRTVVLARGDRLTGLMAAVLYVAHSALPGGVATNTEILFAPFVTAGWALAIVAARDVLETGRAPGQARLLGMGLCFGMALWVKQVVAPEACLAFAAVLALVLLRRTFGRSGGAQDRGRTGWGRVLGLAGAFAIGCAAPTAATALVYAAQGEFGAFYEATFVAPLRYAAVASPDANVSARLILAGLLQVAWLLAAAAVAVAVAIRGGALARLRIASPLAAPTAAADPRPISGQRALLPIAALVWFVGATIGIVMPAKFFGHYFLMWLPPLCLAAALGLRALVAMAAPRLPRLVLLAVVAVIASMPVLNDTAARARSGFALRLPDPSRVVATTIARMLPAAGAAPETAFLVNYEPIVYFLANLPLPTRVPFWQQLTGEYGNAIGQESDVELARVLGNRPALIVISPRSWDQVRPAAQEMVQTALADAYDGPVILQDGISEVEIWRRR